MFLFGAGASFGSEPHPSWEPPPLGGGLFARLKKRRNSLASTLPAELQKAFELNFEDGMRAFTESEFRTLRQRFQRELAAFLSEFWPRPTNLYVRLLRSIGSNIADYSFATLNYDILLERSARHVSSQAVEALKYRSYHLHGSVRCLPDVNISGGNISGNFLDAIVPIRCTLDEAEIRAYFRGDNPLAPAIAVYAKGKLVPTAPDHVADMQREWLVELRQTDHVVIVGTKFVPDDVHIWNNLGRATARVTYVAYDEGEAEPVREWSRLFGRSKDSIIVGSFQARFKDILAAST